MSKDIKNYKYFFIPIFLGLISCQFIGPNSSQKNDNDSDATFIYYQILENHPGVYNQEDPEFKNNLDTHYLIAKKSLNQAKTKEQRRAILENFARSFNDTHVWISWHKKDNICSKKLERDKISIKNIFPKIVWIKLKTFDLRQAERQLQTLLEKIASYRNYSAIVFDLRENSGGNSDYGSKIVRALFSEKYAKQHYTRATAETYVDWRASLDNLFHIQQLLKSFPNEWIKKTEDGMKKSLKNKEIYYREFFNNLYCQNTGKNPVQAKIIVIIDKHNMSASLDFVDELKMMHHNITLIGEKTKSDRLYMEVRTVKLPSRLGEFSFPIKVYRKRIRGDNVSYYPDFEIDTNCTQKLENFVIDGVTKLKF
jgi:hypothetical protein